MRGYWGRQEFQERKRQRHLELIDERRARRAKAMANALHHVSMAGAMNLAEMRAIEQRSKLRRKHMQPNYVLSAMPRECSWPRRCAKAG